MKVAVLGCGQISPLHIENWQKIPGVEIALVVDIEQKQAFKRQKEYAIKEISCDYTAAINRPEIDVIDVCLPTYLH